MILSEFSLVDLLQNTDLKLVVFLVIGEDIQFNDLSLLLKICLELFRLIKVESIAFECWGEINLYLRFWNGERPLNLDLLVFWALSISFSNHDVILLLWARVFSFEGELKLLEIFSILFGEKGPLNCIFLPIHFLLELILSK